MVEFMMEKNIDEITESTNDNMVDYVFPYVNSNDEVWMESYIKHFSLLNKNKDEVSSGIVRYKDYGFLDTKIESIYLNMPWINNIFILISNETQLSEDFHKKYPNIKIIYHNEFIPEEFLPTFNSNTIEMFLGNIPGLSEKFIYSNDDIIVTNKVHYTDCFNENLPIVELNKRFKKRKRLEVCNIANGYIYNALLLTKNEKYTGFIEDEKYMLSFNHADKPLLKSICNEVLTKFKNEIENSITQFRDYKNFNVYLFLFYMTFNEKCVHGNLSYEMINYVDITSLYILKSSKYKNISIDFLKDIDEEEIEKIKKWLKRWISNKHIKYNCEM